MYISIISTRTWALLTNLSNLLLSIFTRVLISCGASHFQHLKPLRLPFSLLLLGPRFRRVCDEPLALVPNISDNGETCRFHAVCDGCRSVIFKSRLICGSWLWLVPSQEYFTLHRSVADFEAAFAARCHLCTLLWHQVHQESDFDPSSGFDGCSVQLKISADGEFGTSKLAMTVLISTESQMEPNKLDWDHLSVAELTLDARHFWMQGRIHSHSGPSALDQYNPHPAHCDASTSSAAHMEMISFWLSECLENHGYCGAKRSDFVPRRLITFDCSSIRLHLTGADDSFTQYCALSHCWGGAEDIPVLNVESLQSLMAGMPIHELPRTFRDAISITRSLGVKFLWIDCLCIIQDSVDDWTTESATMGLIYENATCTILAAAAADAHQGCFQFRKPLSYAPCRLVRSGTDALFASDPRVSAYTSSQDTPLYQRAWTFQERLLSPRVLEFGKYGISWRCMQGEASELKPHGVGFYRVGIPDLPHIGAIFGPSAEHQYLERHVSGYLESFLRLQGLSVSFKDKHQPGDGYAFHKLWFDIVKEYSRGNLTRPTDKLVALSGTVQRIKHTNPDAKYLAGLWNITLELDLLWYVSGVPEPRPREYRAPTWSWASTDGSIVSIASIPTEYMPMARIVAVDIFTRPLDTSQSGEALGGSLRLDGFLKSTTTLSWTRSSSSYRNFYAMTIRERKKTLGYFLPDIPGPWHVTYLLPLRKTPKRGSTQLPSIPDDPPIIPFGFPYHGIWGLALEDRGGCFVRLGLFAFEWEKDGSRASRWFDDCVEQNIIIR